MSYSHKALSNLSTELWNLSGQNAKSYSIRNIIYKKLKYEIWSPFVLMKEMTIGYWYFITTKNILLLPLQGNRGTTAAFYLSYRTHSISPESVKYSGWFSQHEIFLLNGIFDEIIYYCFHSITLLWIYIFKYLIISICHDLVVILTR